MLDLFADSQPWQEPLAPGAVILRRFAFNTALQLVQEIEAGARRPSCCQQRSPRGYTTCGG
ncbi:alpha-ketoglutarate-dependent dioxygenase, partial [Vibrio parahaemolyticus]